MPFVDSLGSLAACERETDSERMSGRDEHVRQPSAGQHARTHARTCTDARARARTHTLMHMHMHMHMHTHTHTYTGRERRRVAGACPLSTLF